MTMRPLQSHFDISLSFLRILALLRGVKGLGSLYCYLNPDTLSLLAEIQSLGNYILLQCHLNIVSFSFLLTDIVTAPG